MKLSLTEVKHEYNLQVEGRQKEFESCTCKREGWFDCTSAKREVIVCYHICHAFCPDLFIFRMHWRNVTLVCLVNPVLYTSGHNKKQQALTSIVLSYGKLVSSKEKKSLCRTLTNQWGCGRNCTSLSLLVFFSCCSIYDRILAQRDNLH